jgi:ribonuclease P protein component
VRRRFRVRHKDDFQRIRQQGTAYAHPWLILSVASGVWPHNRYGIIAPKRLGKAVRRNQLRRRVREALRGLHPRLRQGYDVVVIGRPAGVTQSFAALQTVLLTLFTKAGLVM